jgi:hypothetical protein
VGPNERELLVFMASVVRNMPSVSRKHQASLDSLIHKVCQETDAPPVDGGAWRLKERLCAHLDQHFEVEDLTMTVGSTGKIFIQNAVLTPRDEL